MVLRVAFQFVALAKSFARSLLARDRDVRVTRRLLRAR